MGSAVFLFGEYMARLEAETPPPVEDDDEAEEDEEDTDTEIETSAVLDLFAEELGTSVTVTLTLYLRVTALYRLLSRETASLAQLAMDQESIGGELTEEALVAAAKLDLHVTRAGDDGTADFDPREFRNALTSG